MFMKPSPIWKYAVGCLLRSQHKYSAIFAVTNKCSVSTTASCSGLKSKWRMPYMTNMKHRHDDMVEKGLVPQDRRSKYIEWNFDAEIYAFQCRVGVQFDESLLLTALRDPSHLQHIGQQQQDHGLPHQQIREQQQHHQESPVESNTALAVEGRTIVEEHLGHFVRAAFPCVPAECGRSIVAFLCTDEVMSLVARGIGLKDLVFAEPYPPSQSVMSQAAFAVVASLAQSPEGRLEKVNAFVIDFVATHMVGRTIWDMWQVEDPLAEVQSVAARSGEGDLEPRLVHKTGSNTIEASYQVALYTEAKNFIGTGYGESINIATTEAARDALSRLFGATLSRVSLPFSPSLPPAHCAFPHSAAGPHTTAVPALLEAWTTDDADARWPNVVLC